MSQFERNLTYFNINKIIYRRDPVTDKPTQSFDWGSFYENGTHECYTLFQSKAKITTYKSLKWHLYVLWYLNPQIDQDMFHDLAYYICYKESGFVTFRVSDQLLQSMIYDVSLMDLDKPPPNKLRKVIFRDYSGLSMNEKLSLVGKLVGRKKLSENDIYEAMLIVHDNKDKISVSKLSMMLGCSTRTIYRNMSNELKKEKELLNKQLQI
jgi:hypothetical protein|tara:strand:- start:1000 stop:1626 length:627 start_codon:yes stop_codon:yes gene_type:complete